MDQSDPVSSPSAVEFPIFTGGPLYRLQQRIRVAQPGKRRLGLAAFYAILVAWVPMALLAAAQGLAIGPTRLESFLMDFEVGVRFFVTVPVFLFAELICTNQLRVIVRHFVEANLVTGETLAQFRKLVEETVRMSRSDRTEMALVGLAYLHSMIAFVYILYYPDPTWRMPIKDGRHVLSLAGCWYFLVAFPLYSLLLLRWMLRIALWWRLLWKISKLDLLLSPAHRDGAGGLGFLSESLSAFSVFVFASTALTAGGLADFIIYEGDTITQHQWEIAGLILFLLLVIAGPMLSFIPKLYEAKENALFHYGALASRHIQYVDHKWMTGDVTKDDAGVDFRAIAHMGSSVKAVRDMSLIPLYKEDMVKFMLAAALPFLPLVTTLIPMDELMKLLLKMVV